jgi:hypothetical protein
MTKYVLMGALATTMLKPADARQQRCRRALSVVLKTLDEMLGHFPHSETGVVRGIPPSVELAATKETHFRST